MDSSTPPNPSIPIHPELYWPKTVVVGDVSVEVARIQEWLCFHGYPVEIDGHYGRKTQGAVSRFFSQPHMEGGRVIDSYRFAALCAPLRKAIMLPSEAPPATLSQAVLHIAQQHLVRHPREIGGQNRGPWVRYYMQGRQGDGWPWCAGFVSTVMIQASIWMKRPYPIHVMSCDFLAQRAQSDGSFVPSGSQEITARMSKSRDEAWIFLVRKSATDWTHTGFAYDLTKFGFNTIEGNTNRDGGREGFEVCQRKRNYDRIDFIRVI